MKFSDKKIETKWVQLQYNSISCQVGGKSRWWHSCFFVVMAFVRPWYNVWSQEMEGKAEFAKAEQNRKIKIEEARANLEAEKQNAQAEIERAKGAAEAIKIENGSITPTYIQYLWVRQQSDLSDKTVIYIPTESNLPLLESTRMNSLGQGNAVGK